VRRSATLCGNAIPGSGSAGCLSGSRRSRRQPTGSFPDPSFARISKLDAACFATQGLVASLHRPGGNVTGPSLQTAELAGKRLQLLTEIVPGLGRAVVLSNPLNPSIAAVIEQTKAAAQSLGVEIHVVEVPGPDQFESAFAAVTRARAGALIVLPDPMLYGQHPRIVTFATASHLPVLFPEKEVVRAGGLIAYGPSIPASFRRAARYVDKILRGAKPADLPVEQPTTFELTVNLQTARAIGVTIPTSILVGAGEVIE